MSGSHFYLTLPSNASLDIFPDNKSSTYRVKLPQPVDLNGEWEVGLYCISYPNTWYTLKSGFDTHIYHADKSGLFSTAFVAYGYYDTMQDIVKAINDALRVESVSQNNIELTYNILTGKVVVRVGNGYQLGLTGRMSIILGFGGADTKITTTTISPHVTDLFPVSTIYVYCDIVQPQVVGDTNAQLLRSIPVRGKSGDLITETFSNVQYVPIQTKSFGDIEILLRTDTGDPVSFERGKVVITLHFRQHTYFT